MVAEARTEEKEWALQTLYVPHRDGREDNEAVGMFVDYRDIAVQADWGGSSVIGMIHQLQEARKTPCWCSREKFHTVVL